MIKKIFFAMIALDIIAGIATVAISNGSIMANATVLQSKERMLELDASHEEFETQYLKLALEHVEPQARADGFVVVNSPQYIRPDAVVGFLTR
jgi:hypothetical protein